ncbi:MAG: hypothetical protein RL642_988, partial [Bacteroidota bacterium]
MMSASDILQIVEKQKILPLFYHADAEVCKGVVEA